jgi:hypothetical protein
VKLYVYPTYKQGTTTIQSSAQFLPAKHLEHLFKYLQDNDKIADIKEAKSEHLHIISDDVLEMIQSNVDGWEVFVPNRVAEAIKKNHLFDFPYEVPEDEEDVLDQ